MVKAGDVRWLAGLLEGEGCFVFSRTTPRIMLSMTDRDVVARAAAMLRNPMGERPPPKPGYKKRYVTNLNGNDAAGWMMTLYGEMGRRRRAKIREVLSRWKQMPGRKGEYNGRAKLTWLQVQEIRSHPKYRGATSLLAKRCGVNRAVIADVISGKTWSPQPSSLRAGGVWPS